MSVAPTPDLDDQREPTDEPEQILSLDGRRRQIDTRIRQIWLVTPGVLLGATSFIVAALIVRTGQPFVWLLVLLGVVTVLVGATWWWMGVRWRRWSWAVSDDAIEVAHGVVVHTESLVPFHRIQQIDVRRGPLERLVGLASLEVHTAAATSDAYIPGVAAEQAETLRHALLSHAGVDDAA